MGNYDTELAFKNHMQFFHNLNKDMDYLRAVSKSANDFNKLIEYYNELENLSVHYSCYIDEKILPKLKEVKEVLITTKYNNFLHNKLSKDEYGKYYNEVLDCIEILKTIHSSFSKSLHDHELFPKLVKTKKKDTGKSLYS